MPIFYGFAFKEDRGHVMGGALSMKWEGRGPLQLNCSDRF